MILATLFALLTMPKWLTDMGVTERHVMLAGVAAIIVALYVLSRRRSQSEAAAKRRRFAAECSAEPMKAAPAMGPLRIKNLGEQAVAEIRRRDAEDEDIRQMHQKRAKETEALRKLMALPPEPPKVACSP